MSLKRPNIAHGREKLLRPGGIHSKWSRAPPGSPGPRAVRWGAIPRSNSSMPFFCLARPPGLVGHAAGPFPFLSGLVASAKRIIYRSFAAGRQEHASAASPRRMGRVIATHCDSDRLGQANYAEEPLRAVEFSRHIPRGMGVPHYTPPSFTFRMPGDPRMSPLAVIKSSFDLQASRKPHAPSWMAFDAAQCGV